MKVTAIIPDMAITYFHYWIRINSLWQNTGCKNKPFFVHCLFSL